MELFLPSIAVLLIAGLVIFLILPRLGAPVLAALSIVLLVYGVYNHMQLFASEYRYSTWQEKLKFYSPFLMIGVMILFVLTYIGYLYGTEGTKALPANLVPANVNNTAVEAVNEAATNIANATVDTVTDAVGTVVDTAKNVAAAAKNVVVNAVEGTKNLLNQGRRNNGAAPAGARNNGLLANLGGILATPAPNNRRGNY